MKLKNKDKLAHTLRSSLNCFAPTFLSGPSISFAPIECDLHRSLLPHFPFRAGFRPGKVFRASMWRSRGVTERPVDYSGISNPPWSPCTHLLTEAIKVPPSCCHCPKNVPTSCQYVPDGNGGGRGAMRVEFQRGVLSLPWASILTLPNTMQFWKLLMVCSPPHFYFEVHRNTCQLYLLPILSTGSGFTILVVLSFKT